MLNTALRLPWGGGQGAEKLTGSAQVLREALSQPGSKEEVNLQYILRFKALNEKYCYTVLFYCF